MGRKHVISKDLFKETTPDMSTTFYSAEINTKELDKAAIHCSWTSGQTGTFELQVKMFEEGPLADTWTSLASDVAPWIIEAADSEVQIIITEMPFVKMRLKWTPTAATGTMTGYMTSKTVGA